MLKNREEKNSELNTKRLDKLWSKKQQDKEKKFDKIRAEHIKSELYIIVIMVTTEKSL